MIKISVFENEEAVSKAAAELIVSISKKTIGEQGKFTIALSGGNTPAMLYQMLANKPYCNEINWKQTFFFWGDERVVNFNSPLNNSYNAKKILLNEIRVPAENIFPVQVNQPADKAANHYEQTLKIFFHADLPSFDLILLGMGEDGHTASIFPGSPLLSEESLLVKEVYHEEQKMHRISFTPPLINNAKNILFLVTGRQKAEMVFKVLEGSSLKYPAKLVKGKKGTRVYWYLDKAAATLIN